jgi:predicted transcriptional regulator
MRVNARLDDETQRQLQYLIEATGSGVSDVLKASLAHYYQKVRADQRPRLRHLSASIGKVGSGRSDISARAKELLADAIGDKVTARQPRRTRDAK